MSLLGSMQVYCQRCGSCYEKPSKARDVLKTYFGCRLQEHPLSGHDPPLELYSHSWFRYACPAYNR